MFSHLKPGNLTIFSSSIGLFLQSFAVTFYYPESFVRFLVMEAFCIEHVVLGGFFFLVSFLLFLPSSMLNFPGLITEVV